MTVYRRGTTYYYDFRLDGRRYVRRVGPRHRAALDAEIVARRRALETRLTREWGLTPRRTVTLTFQAFLDGPYATEARSHYARSWVVRQLSLLRGPARVMGSRRLADITPEHLRAYFASRTGQVGPTTIRNEIAILRRFFAQAMAAGLCPTNPARDVVKPRPHRGPDRILTLDEEARLYAAAPTTRHAVALRLFGLGCRRTELVHVPRGAVDLAGRRLVYVQPKTQRIRRLPLDAETLRQLRALPLAPLEAPLLAHDSGRPYASTTVYDWFRLAARRAGIRGVRPHDLRHTFATRLAQKGYDLATVGELLGHTPPYRETLRYFAHTSEARLREAVDAIRPAP